MIHKKLKDIRTLSYFGLVLFSTIFGETTFASEEKESYRTTHNRLAQKYNLHERVLPENDRPQTRSEDSSAEGFANSARTLREKMEEKRQKAQENTEDFVKTLGEGTKMITKHVVKDSKTQNFLLNFIDKAQRKLLTFLN